jgi:folate-dependent phosphoribosylglycinamide formyltransferase PurN
VCRSCLAIPKTRFPARVLVEEHKIYPRALAIACEQILASD